MTTTPHATDEDAVRKALADELAEKCVDAAFNKLKAETREMLITILSSEIVQTLRAPPLSLPHSGEPVAWRWPVHGGGWNYSAGKLKPTFTDLAEPLFISPPTTQIGGGALEATTAQHFDLPKGEPARFVRGGILETCQCRECRSLAAPKPQRSVAREEIYRQALEEIRGHWANQYDHPRKENEMYRGPYGIGVTDGHRACTIIAEKALSASPTELHEGGE